MSSYNYLISKPVRGCLPSSSVPHSPFLTTFISADVRHPVVPVDLNESRRVKMQKFYDALPRNARGTSENVFIIADIADSSNFLLQLWHGCHTVLEA
jgi:hypothetical protein